MDQRFFNCLSDQADNLKDLRVIHLGAVGKTLWFSQFLNKYLKSDFLEEIGFLVFGPMNKIDLQFVFENCPNLHRLYLNVQRDDVKNIHLSNLLQVSVLFCERMTSLNIKQKSCKVLLDPKFMLNSVF